MASMELLTYCTHVEPHHRDFMVLKLTAIEPGFKQNCTNKSDRNTFLYFYIFDNTKNQISLEWGRFRDLVGKSINFYKCISFS